MDLMQLKMPPDKVRIMADAIERDIGEQASLNHADDLKAILVWLRYRIQRWEARHPTTPAA